MQKMQKIKFYRVEYLNGSNPFLINSQLKLHDLYEQIKHKIGHQDFVIYYHFKPYKDEENGNIKLREIVAHEPMPSPTFIIYDFISDSNLCPFTQKYGEGIAIAQKYDEPPKEYSVGQNGMILFDNRNASLLASSIDHAASFEGYSSEKKEIIENFKSSIIEEEDRKSDIIQQNLIRKVLSKIGIIKTQPTAKNLMKTIDAIKNVKTKEDLLKHIDREYSDYDPKFAAYLEAIYLKYAILSAYKLHYIEYKNMQQGVIKYKFPSNAKVAIIGDFGTGLNDSFELLRHIILVKQADIILHLGDVYYAGTPNEYKNHVMDPLNKIRKEAAEKFKKDVLFYSIPGNHDYYTWGLPYLCFIANANEVKQVTGNILKNKTKKQHQKQDKDAEENLTKQEASYFCLQSEDSKWQFIGLDTAYHDSNPINQINGLSLGPRLRQKQMQWFVDKMENFPGSTILLTHHQLFSIHDRICGSMSKYQAFTCVNPLLSAQLFKYLPSISCWFWGHEHSLMFFDDDVMGVRKCRLLGNSSFHVFSKEGPYLRKKGFPYIPLICPDEEYMKKYLPLNPQSDDKNADCYFNLSYALIDFSKQKTLENTSQFSSTLTAQYYCCPCYPENQIKKKHFTPYLIYQQQIQPRANVNVITSQKLLQDEHEVVGNIHEITEGTELFMKAQIGLFADKGTRLSLSGVRYQVYIHKSVNEQFATQDQQSTSNMTEIQSIQMKQDLSENRDSKEIKQELNQEQKKKEEINMEVQPKNHRKILLDGDIITFNEVKATKKQNHKPVSPPKSKQPHSSTKPPHQLPAEGQQQPKITQSTDLLGKLPELKQVSSIHSSQPENIPRQSQQIVDQIINQVLLHDILQDKKLEIKKHRVFKDTTVHIKFGDAFSLRDIDRDQYLSCQIGMYGGVLKLAKLKPNEQPCLFMFINDSKVKLVQSEIMKQF